MFFEPYSFLLACSMTGDARAPELTAKLLWETYPLLLLVLCWELLLVFRLAFLLRRQSRDMACVGTQALDDLLEPTASYHRKKHPIRSSLWELFQPRHIGRTTSVTIDKLLQAYASPHERVLKMLPQAGQTGYLLGLFYVFVVLFEQAHAPCTRFTAEFAGYVLYAPFGGLCLLLAATLATTFFRGRFAALQERWIRFAYALYCHRVAPDSFQPPDATSLSPSPRVWSWALTFFTGLGLLSFAFTLWLLAWSVPRFPFSPKPKPYPTTLAPLRNALWQGGKIFPTSPTHTGNAKYQTYLTHFLPAVKLTPQTWQTCLQHDKPRLLRILKHETHYSLLLHHLHRKHHKQLLGNIGVKADGHIHAFWLAWNHTRPDTPTSQAFYPQMKKSAKTSSQTPPVPKCFCDAPTKHNSTCLERCALQRASQCLRKSLQNTSRFSPRTRSFLVTFPLSLPRQ